MVVHPGKFKSCIFIMADGARADVFEELLKQGNLPNIAKYIIERGSYRNAVTVFPSTTGPAYTPYIMGKFPGRCNLPGIRWFDREVYGKKVFSLMRSRSYIGHEGLLLNSDISKETPTLFEVIPQSASILNELSRGISLKGDKTKLAKFYLKLKSHFTDGCDEVDIAAKNILLRTLKENPQYVCVVFLGIDTYSHLNHPFHKKVIDSYLRIDEAVGALARTLTSEGKLDDTLLVLGSDHGLTQTHSHFDTLGFMDGLGYKTFYYPNIFKHFVGATAATMVSGNAMAHLYIKSAEGWQRRSTFEELLPVVNRLLERPEVDVITGLDENGRVRIRSQRGEAVTWLDNKGYIRYEGVYGDPLGYNGSAEEKMDINEALQYSYHTDYPDALLQIIQLFESPRTGDLVISASRGFDLRAKHENPEHCSSHGALFRDHMIVPLCISTKINREFVRTVDVFPTILSQLGYPIPAPIDGVSLVD